MINIGDKIRVGMFIMGKLSHTEDFTIEKFRDCLGIFASSEAREAGDFTALCYLYRPGPNSEQKYIPNYGEYWTNLVPNFEVIESSKILRG